MPLEQQITHGGARTHFSYFTKMQLRIESTTSCGAGIGSALQFCKSVTTRAGQMSMDFEAIPHFGKFKIRRSRAYLLAFADNLEDDMAAEQDRFSLQTHAVDGDETRCANEIDTDQEYTQLALHLARIDNKMKIRQLLIEEKDSIEGNVAAFQGRFTSVESTELEAELADTEEEGPSAFGLEIFGSTSERFGKGSQRGER
ncbi:hypothetical protein AXG93_3104s1090 [Marchantia polymorpha subsp. ruderalis]|uniref:Uncharacterized protein n=1 Tax=Marchantia polymorpha subsp. ruderalis TaxID=1480154 RepID=A0A176WPK3_MARPO|nr:hypothetical protein AXG93_3104s1090 [Marchantia polymorpha subsp. ruderalis]